MQLLHSRRFSQSAFAFSAVEGTGQPIDALFAAQETSE